MTATASTEVSAEALRRGIDALQQVWDYDPENAEAQVRAVVGAVMAAPVPAPSPTVLACTDEPPSPELVPSHAPWGRVIERDDFAQRPSWDIGYEVLRDVILTAFNPADDDVAEESLLTDALDRVYAFVAAQPCRCKTDVLASSAPCDRCQVLGRALDRPVSQ